MITVYTCLALAHGKYFIKGDYFNYLHSKHWGKALHITFLLCCQLTELTDVKDKNPEVSFSISWMEGWNLNPIHCKCLSAFHILLILTFLPSSDVVVLSYPQRTDSERVWNTPYILHWVGESNRAQDQIPRLLAQCFSHYNYSDYINLQIEIT